VDVRIIAHPRRANILTVGLPAAAVTQFAAAMTIFECQPASRALQHPVAQRVNAAFPGNEAELRNGHAEGIHA
jgi:hypothetical protein